MAESQKAKPARSKRAYHHGDLRQALLDAGLAAIERGDYERFSLRSLARQIGVANAAPYHHFRDKAALLEALVRRGFELMEASMVHELRGLPEGSDALARLSALGRGYILFATRHAAHYQAMWSTNSGDEHETAGQSCFMRLLQAVAELREIEPHSDEAMRYSLVCWSATHGVASLWSAGRITSKFHMRDPEVAANIVTEVLAKAVAP